MAKQAQPLFDLKVSGFTGIASNVNPFANPNAVLRATNLIANDEPGILIQRPPYYLKYETPVDTLERLQNAKPISFDNFYETLSTGGTEVTVEIQSAAVVAPNNIAGVAYTFNSPIIWMRPFFNGTFWEDKWGWLNESIITNIVAGPDSTYKNQFDIQGKFGNLIQYSIINITRDETLSAAVLEYAEGVTNTTIYISTYNNNWQNGDVVVLMKNYIPLKYLLQMFYATQQDISFHRIPSKLRIGFGGKSGRIALGIDFVNTAIEMADYNFTNTAPALVSQELLWDTAKRMVIQPYTIFNEDNKDFGLNILTDLGSWPAATYYFRVTAILDGLNEVLVLETSIKTITNLKFFPIPWIRSGSISRRLTSLNVYFGLDNGTGSIAYNLFMNYPVSDPAIKNKLWNLDNDGKLQFTQPASIDTNIYTETSSAKDTTEYAVGSWIVPTDEWQYQDNEIVIVGSAGAYRLASRIKASGLDFYFQIGMILPPAGLSVPLKSNVAYTLYAQYKCTSHDNIVCTLVVSFYVNGIKSTSTQIPAFPGVLTSFSFDMVSPVFTETDVVTIRIDYISAAPHNLFPLDGIEITGFQVIEKQTNFLDLASNLGVLDESQMGYPPASSLVRDWGTALIRNGSTFAGNAFIDQKYPTLIFFSPVSGDGTSQYDVLPDDEANILDADKDNSRGETVIALAQMNNTWLLALTEGGGTIINPDNGETQEVPRGLGILSKDSIAYFRGRIFWGSTDDLVATDNGGYNADVIDENSVRDIYKTVPDKTLVTGCIDQYGCYHVGLGFASPVQELLMTNRGWFDLSREHYPQVLRNCFLGVVWFMDPQGNIYSGPSVLPQDVGYADIYGDYRSGW